VAGTAAALLGVSQYALGAVAAPLVGLGGSDTALPMATVIAVCAVGAALAFEVLVSRPRDGSARIAEGTTAP
jgi:DHA1 family bicyclomycin/chloramphenicol resistance-like MFS transporter